MYRAWNEKEKVPVFKNTIYALKLVWKTEKSQLWGYLISKISDVIFFNYIQNILFLRILLNIIYGNREFAFYVKSLSLLVAVSALLNIVSWWGYYKKNVAAKKVLRGLNNLVFEKAGSLDIGCYEDPEFYDKYQRATDVMSNGYFDIICWDVAEIIGRIVSFFCVITTVAFINKAYLVFLAPICLVFVFLSIKNKLLYKRNVEMTRNNRTKSYVQRTVFLKDYSKDMRTSNIFSVIMQKFNNAIESNIEIYKKYGPKIFACSLLHAFFCEIFPTFGSYAYAAYEFIARKGLTVSDFSVIIPSIHSLCTAAYRINECVNELTYLAMYFQNLREFLEYEPKISGGELEAGEFEELELRNVTFTYPGAKEPSLKNVSFKINNKSTVAVVGMNGAGKSTLVKLLLRFYDPDEGEILYNGTNIKKFNLASYRNSFATVFQDYKNFALSVFENVMCRECDENDRLVAEASLKKSGVWQKISSFANGGDTVLTREFDENGAGLSGGEGQKVSAARLFARDFRIAILDEPSSALDPVAEHKMYENLINATKDRAVIYISHRLSSAVMSDEIFVIKNGELIEHGSHNELMEAGGEYSEMFALQASSYGREEEFDENQSEE